MKLQLQSTSQIVTINGVECRVWEGTTVRGVAVTAFVARVAVDVKADAREFERELRETAQPRPTTQWPARLVWEKSN